MSEKRLIDDVRKIAALLPGKWTVKDPSEPNDGSWWASVENCDGRKLHFRADDRKKGAPRVEISGIWPSSKSQGVIAPARYADNEKGTFEITVARNRGAAAIAAEIKRRLLPDYSRVFVICKARAEYWDENDRRRNEVAAELRQLVGDTKSFPNRDPKSVCAAKLDGVLDIEVRGPDCVHFRMDISLEAAKAVIAVLKKRTKTSD